MASIFFTANLKRHIDAPDAVVPGGSVADALGHYFELHPAVRGYVLDDQGALRHHMAVFVDGQQVRDRDTLGDVVTESSEIYVMQALSGG